MNESRHLLIEQIDGLTPLISHIFSMMNYARIVTRLSIEDLTIAELDHLHDEQSNSIGALLKHIAGVEVAYQLVTFENDRDMTPEEHSEWDDALDLGEAARKNIHGNPVEYYIEKLNSVRRKTLEEFKKRDDEWLMQESRMWGLPTNNYFMWFHVAEDEVNHRGQINWLRKRLPKIA